MTAQPTSEAQPAASSPRLAAIWGQKESLLLAMDFAIALGALLLVWKLGYRWLQGRQEAFAKPVVMWKTGIILAGAWVLLHWYYSVYERGLRGIASPIVRVRSVVKCGIGAAAVLVIATSLYGAPPLSIWGWSATLGTASAAMLIVRVILRRFDRMLAARGVICQRVVVVGTDRRSREFAIRLRARRSTVRVVGMLLPDGGSARPTFLRIPVLGRLADLQNIFGEFRIDALVLPPEAWGEAGESRRSDLLTILNFCEAHGITCYVAPSSYDIAVRRQEVASFSDVPLVRLEDASLRPAYAVVKRCMDAAAAAAGLILGLPLWIVIALAVKLSSKGPVFFAQTRVGLHGRTFRMYKFRSMVSDAEKILEGLIDVDSLREPVFKLRKDPRVTRIGRFLRRSGLDEIPQLWNVLRGQMSLVGPRPEEQRVVARYNAHQRRRLKAKPGLTGLQQVECRGSKSLSQRLTYDLIYMKHQSLLLDLYILFMTVVVVVRGSGTSH